MFNVLENVHTLSEGHVPVDVSGFGNQELDEPKHCLPADMRHEQRAMNSERPKDAMSLEACQVMACKCATKESMQSDDMQQCAH